MATLHHTVQIVQEWTIAIEKNTWNKLKADFKIFCICLSYDLTVLGGTELFKNNDFDVVHTTFYDGYTIVEFVDNKQLSNRILQTTFSDDITLAARI